MFGKSNSEMTPARINDLIAMVQDKKMCNMTIKERENHDFECSIKEGMVDGVPFYTFYPNDIRKLIGISIMSSINIMLIVESKKEAKNVNGQWSGAMDCQTSIISPNRICTSGVISLHTLVPAIPSREYLDDLILISDIISSFMLNDMSMRRYNVIQKVGIKEGHLPEEGPFCISIIGHSLMLPCCTTIAEVSECANTVSEMYRRIKGRVPVKPGDHNMVIGANVEHIIREAHSLEVERPNGMGISSFGVNGNAWPGGYIALVLYPTEGSTFDDHTPDSSVATEAMRRGDETLNKTLRDMMSNGLFDDKFTFDEMDHPPMHIDASILMMRHDTSVQVNSFYDSLLPKMGINMPGFSGLCGTNPLYSNWTPRAHGLRSVSQEIDMGNLIQSLYYPFSRE